MTLWILSLLGALCPQGPDCAMEGGLGAGQASAGTGRISTGTRSKLISSGGSARFSTIGDHDRRHHMADDSGSQPGCRIIGSGFSDHGLVHSGRVSRPVSDRPGNRAAGHRMDNFPSRPVPSAVQRLRFSPLSRSVIRNWEFRHPIYHDRRDNGFLRTATCRSFDSLRGSL